MPTSFPRRSLVLSALALPALAACSGGADPSGVDGSTESGDFAPTSVKHIYGTTKIPAAPTKIATISWVNADTLLALGLIPVGMPAVEWGGNANKSTDWIDAKLDELGAGWDSGKAPTLYSEADGINFDEIAALTPDLIIGAYSGLAKEDYDKLAKIAPTIGPLAPNYTAPWEEVLAAVGTATGLADKATALREKLSTDLKKVGEDNPAVAGATFIAGSLTLSDHKISLYAAGDTRPRFFTALGMTQADVVTKNTKDSSTFSFDWSAERADELVSDVLYTWAAKGDTIQTFQKDPLFSTIPAIAKGALVLTADDHETLAISAASALSLPWALEHIVPSVITAAEKSGS